MQHPDEGMVHAWLDGELSLDERAAIETHVASCAECSAAVAEARGLVAASSRIVSALDVVPGDVIPVARGAKRPWYTRTQFRAAAAVLFVAAASLVVLRPGGEARRAEVSSRITGAPIAGAERASDAAAAAAPMETPAAAKVGSSAAQARSQPLAGSQRAARERIDTRPRSVGGSAREGSTGRAISPTTAEADGKAVGGAIERSQQSANADRTFAQSNASADLKSGARPAPPAPVVAQRSRMEEATVAAGAAAAPAMAARVDLKLLRADTTGGTRVAVYRFSSGLEVTLTETPLPSRRMAKEQERRIGAATSAASPAAPLRAKAAPPPAVRDEAAKAVAPVISISWQDTVARRNFVLTGPASREQLEAIRQRLEREDR